MPRFLSEKRNAWKLDGLELLSVGSLSSVKGGLDVWKKLTHPEKEKTRKTSNKEKKHNTNTQTNTKGFLKPTSCKPGLGF